MHERQSRVLGGTMLVAGTSIGAAILAMPILTGLFGFIGTALIMVACWFFMYWTAMLILEATLQFEDGVSFISMSRILGPAGAGLTWLVFLLLFYSLLAAYLSGSGHIIIDALEGILKVELPPFFDILPLLVVFAPFLYFGLSVVDRLNRYLMIGMIFTYLAITVWLLPHVRPLNLSYIDPAFSLLSFSVIVTSFGYHVIIPTLVTYLDRDVKNIKRCLFYGSIIPLFIYFVWEFSILGTLPVSGIHGLAYAFEHNIPLARLLRSEMKSDFIAVLARGFSIFAIVTSFLGVAQGLYDFLKDGLKAHGSHRRQSLAFVLTFLPPVLLIIFVERGFIALLEYAGAMVSIILGIVPILIVWVLRSRKNKVLVYRAPGNQWALIGGIIFFAFVVTLVILKNMNIINFPVTHLI